MSEPFLVRRLIRDREVADALVLPAVWRTVVDWKEQCDWLLASSHLLSQHVRARGAHVRCPEVLLRPLTGAVQPEP